MKKYREIVGGSVFFVCAAAYFAMAFDIKQFNDGFLSSDFMPKFYGVILMVLSALQVIFGVVQLKKSAEPGEESGPDVTFGQILSSVAMTFVLLIGYVALLKPVGFFIMSSVFIFLMVLMLSPKEERTGKRSAAVAVIAVAFSAAVYLIFTRGFALTLPAGILG